MNYDRQLKQHRLLRLAEIFERDREVRADFIELGMSPEWLTAQAAAMRRLCALLGEGNALQ
jgi:hypothetical protein